MFERRSLTWPIILGVTMIVFLVAILIGWVLLAVFGAIGDGTRAPLYWTLLTVGTVFLVYVLVGVIMYLTISVKSVRLSVRQSNFIDSVTHELKSPIASLKLYLQTLNRRQVSPEQREDFYRYMLEDIERLDRLINHLLDAGLVDKGLVEEEIDEIEVSALLRQCATSVCSRYRVSKDAVTFDLQPCVVRARQVDLDMLFRNLIDNAIKYAGDPPQVQISLRSVGQQQVEVQIGDNGRGIPGPLRRKIFGRFVRLGMELEREKPGTGLGLHIVRTLVKRLKGKIRVRGREQVSGTIFEVTLPGEPAPVDEPPAAGGADVQQRDVA